MASYISPSDVEAEIRAENPFGASTTPTKSEVEQWIEEASDEVRDVADTEFGSETVTDELYHYYGTNKLAPRNTPLQSVSEVEYNQGDIKDTDWTTLTEDDEYTVLPNRSQIYFLQSFYPKEGLKKFRLDYTYGRSSVPAKIQKLVTKMVALRVLDSLLASDVENENAGSDVQVGSIQVKKPADYGVVNYKQLKEQIQQLRDEIKTGSRTYRTNTYV